MKRPTPALEILLVEDNATTRKMLRVALEAEGYRVSEAPDGSTALASAGQELPDLVLQDLVLPDTDGFQLVRELRALPGMGEVPILALSGLMSHIAEAHAVEAGFTDVLIKPVEPSRLVEAVRGALPSVPPSAEARVEGRKVLLVDDDPVQLKLARIHFSQLGFDVAVASNGAEALDLAERGAPEAILSDVLMPGMDGFQLCLAVRQSRTLATIPVVLVSAQYRSDADQALARRVGAHALVQRTPDFDHAVEAVLGAIASGTSGPIDEPSLAVQLEHAQVVIRQLERQAAVSAGLSRRCMHQAAQLSLLSGVAHALAHEADPELALGDVLAATLDAAGISKGALFLEEATSTVRLRQSVGFSGDERSALEGFFGQMRLLEECVERCTAVTLRASSASPEAARAVLERGGIHTAQIVPLSAEGRGVGAIVLGATQSDVAGEDTVAFARAMGNQMVQSLRLASTFARLSASELRYRAVLEGAHDAIALLTPEGIIRELNHRWEEILGCSRAELLGTSIYELSTTTTVRARLVDREVNTPTRGYGRKAESGGDVTRRLSRLQLERLDSRTVILQFENTTLEVDGELLVFAVGRDMTDQVEAQERLLVSERMASLGMMAAGVAHEINNPLTAVTGNLDLAATEASSLLRGAGGSLATLEATLLDAREAALRVRNIVGDLRVFSRDAGSEERGPVDVHIVLDSALRLAQNEIRHRAQVVKAYGTVPQVLANESRLGQVILNLLVNAIHAIPEGCADANRITLRTRHAVDEWRVVIEVEDTGSGMPPEVVRKLFTPFFTTKEIGVGTGLGLAIAHRIITSLGGDITVDSHLGRGTLMRVVLPAAVDAQAPRVHQARPVVEAPSRRGRLLVVDDDGMVATVLSRFLSPEHDVCCLSSAHEALAWIERGERFDVILCDLMMPVMTGMELHAALAEQAPEQADRMVFVTGGAFTPGARDFLDTVPHARLEKPIDAHVLRSIVNGRVRQPPT